MCSGQISKQVFKGIIIIIRFKASNLAHYAFQISTKIFRSKSSTWSVNIIWCKLLFNPEYLFREKINKNATWRWNKPTCHFKRFLSLLGGHLWTILIPFSRIGLKNTCEPSFCPGHLRVSKKKNLIIVYHGVQLKKWCKMRPMVHKCPYFLIPWCTYASQEVPADRQTAMHISPLCIHTGELKNTDILVPLGHLT